MFFSTPLQRAIAAGMKPRGDLAEELGKLENYPIQSRKDAKAICDALRQLPLPAKESETTSPLHVLTGLFQDVEGRDAPAFNVLRDEGLPQLIRIFNARVRQADNDEKDDLLFVLKILAAYGSHEGADKIVQAARQPLKPDAYMWHPILSAFSEGHPERDYVFRELSSPLPPGFIAMSLLDSANAAALEGDLEQHPFDSPAGREQLQQWLAGSDPERFSYAQSATVALPFISNPQRDQLLALAMDHVDPAIQMEAAWAAGKLGREAGLKVLARFALDMNHSEVAQRYLTELDREDLIPPEANEPDFKAKATFAQWLAHPNELGKPPDELEIVDQRQLAWPPDRELQPFWLLRYCVRDRSGLEEDDIDCGLVGSMTWCFFSYSMDQRPPEDVYAIHCYWEMEHDDLITENEVTDAQEYAALLVQWRGAPLEDAKIIHIAELSPKLNAQGRLVALAIGKLEGSEGWMVLDGPRSTWYPKAEQPENTFKTVPLKIHVGRQLLGFQDSPDRRKYLLSDQPRREPQEIIVAYEKLVSVVSGAEPKRQKELLGSHSLLERHFEKYVDALSAIRGTSRPDTLIEIYGQFLRLAAQADSSVQSDVHDSFSVLGEHFPVYVDALVSKGRSSEIAALIELFSPHWDHNLGYARLGSAAFKAGPRDVAEKYFVKLRSELEDYCRGEEMSLLAEIWHGRGEQEQAKELLVDCLQKLVTMIKESKYNSDRETYAEEFRYHRATYLRLFPGSEQELAKLGLPASPQ